MNIVITGASSGIGYQAALRLISDASNKVIALARSEDKLQDLLSNLEQDEFEKRLFVKKFDIIHGDYEDDLLPFIKACIGDVDILINNAGSLINKPFEELTQLDFAEMLQSNFLGHVKMINHLLSIMSINSHIVNIGSMGGYQGSVKFPGLAAYSASKAALHTLTECLALELADQEIKINCLALGSAQTEMLERAFPGYKSPVEAADMGELVADFALTGHKFFNGKVIPVSVTTP